MDNSIDAGKRLDANRRSTRGRPSAFKVEVVFGMIPRTKDGYYYDNVGMDELDMDRYRQFHRGSTHREKNIGKHGLGGKQADYQLSSKGSTHIISRKDGVYRFMKFDWNKMENDYLNDSDSCITDNVSSPTIYRDLASLLSEEFPTGTPLVDLTKLSSDGTYNIYSGGVFQDAFEEIRKEWTIPNKFGKIYSVFLEDDTLSLRITDKNNISKRVIPYDLLHIKSIIDKYGGEKPRDALDNDMYGDFQIPVRKYRDGCYTFDVRDINRYQPDDEKIKPYLNWNGSRCTEANNPHDGNVFHESSIQIQQSCTWGCTTVDPDSGGSSIYRMGRLLGESFYIKALRKRDHNNFRSKVSYNDLELDSLFHPGINKSKFLPSNAIVKLLNESFIPFIGQFPKSKKLYDKELENQQQSHPDSSDFGSTPEAEVTDEAENKTETKTTDEASDEATDETETEATDETETKTEVEVADETKTET
ncbi:MAG: hypothetical protein HRU26_07090 [Psychroserpens sp.]|nr:hypothetical protein [Psychroserpens sp.]